MFKDKKKDKERINVLFFGRDNCSRTKKIISLFKKLDFKLTTIISIKRGNEIPKKCFDWKGDYIFCFRSLFILPQRIIKNARIAAINFHPGPPDYPGSGCINFALYNDSKKYGVTTHIMNEKVDNGAILDVVFFEIDNSDTVDSLLKKTHDKLFFQFKNFINQVFLKGENFINKQKEASKNIKWKGEALKMKDLENLKIIDKDITKKELQRIVRATYTKDYPPVIILHGHQFALTKKII